MFEIEVFTLVSVVLHQLLPLFFVDISENVVLVLVEVVSQDLFEVGVVEVNDISEVVDFDLLSGFVILFGFGRHVLTAESNYLVPVFVRFFFVFILIFIQRSLVCQGDPANLRITDI